MLRTHHKFCRKIYTTASRGIISICEQLTFSTRASGISLPQIYSCIKSVVKIRRHKGVMDFMIWKYYSVNKQNTIHPIRKRCHFMLIHAFMYMYLATKLHVSCYMYACLSEESLEYCVW